MRAVMEVVTVSEWRRVIAKALEDCDSVDPITRTNARKFLKEILIGRPHQGMGIPADDGANTNVAEMSDTELKEFIAQAEKELTDVDKQKIQSLTIELEDESGNSVE